MSRIVQDIKYLFEKDPQPKQPPSEKQAWKVGPPATVMMVIILVSITGLTGVGLFIWLIISKFKEVF